MILHHKERIKDVTFYVKTPLRYSDTFTFIPIQYKYKGKCDDIIFQTPQLFIPYGVRELDNQKMIIDISFLNGVNDVSVVQFYEDINSIYTLFHKRYSSTYKVHPFMKETMFSKCMRCKVNPTSHFYNQGKQRIKTLNPFTYGRFLLRLSGLWVIDGEIWFQWVLLQGQVETPYQLDSYSFIDEESVQDKYQKMLKMGVPQAAVNQQKKMDKVPPPPPPPPPSGTTSNKSSRLEISSSELKSVKLKKAKKQEQVKHKTNHRGYEPPTKEELQVALSKLQTPK